MTKEEEARLEEIARAKIKEHLCGVNGFFRALSAWPNRIGYDDAHSVAVGALIDAGAGHLTAREIADRVALSFVNFTGEAMKASVLSFWAAVTFLVAGLIWGLVMAISQDFSTMPAHAHLNLLGWVSLFLFGIYYRLHPWLEG